MMNKNLSKRGRPTLPESQRRSNVRCFVMRDDEDQLLDDICNVYGITMSNAIRLCIAQTHHTLFSSNLAVNPEDYA